VTDDRAGLDTELRRIFASEAQARLARLSSGLAQLGRVVGAGQVDALVRDAHNLKGAAAMVRLDPIARVAQTMEDALDGVRDGTTAPTPALIQGLLRAVGAVQAMIPEALAGGDITARANTHEQALLRLFGPR
jgi:two-component system sensor histidine kinase and response regulator WspE